MLTAIMARKPAHRPYMIRIAVAAGAVLLGVLAAVLLMPAIGAGIPRDGLAHWRLEFMVGLLILPLALVLVIAALSRAISWLNARSRSGPIL